MFCRSLFVLFRLAILLSVLRSMASGYRFGILWPLCCLSFDLWLLDTALVSCDHCVVCPSIYGFWISLWYLQTILVSVQSVPITTKVVHSNPAHSEVYSIQHYEIKFDSDLRQVLRFPPPIKLTATTI